MKRLLLVSLLLCIASLSSATLTLDINDDTIGLQNDVAGNYYTNILWSMDLDSHFVSEGLTPLGIGVPTWYRFSGVYEGGTFTTAELGLPSHGLVRVKHIDIVSVAMIGPGIHYTVQFQDQTFGRTDYGAGYVALFDEDLWHILDIVYVVPEPATLALLGAGAWLLRRRGRIR